MLRTHTCTHTHICTCTLAHTQRDMHIYVYTCAHLHVHTYAHMHTCTHSGMHTSMHTSVHTHTNTRRLLIISDFHRHLRWGTHQGQGAAFQPSKHGILVRYHHTPTAQHSQGNSWPTAPVQQALQSSAGGEASPPPLLGFIFPMTISSAVFYSRGRLRR